MKRCWHCKNLFKFWKKKSFRLLIPDRFYEKSPNFIKFGWVTKKLWSKIYQEDRFAPPPNSPSLISVKTIKGFVELAKPNLYHHSPVLILMQDTGCLTQTSHSINTSKYVLLISILVLTFTRFYSCHRNKRFQNTQTWLYSSVR